jgi:hypothetical protein
MTAASPHLGPKPSAIARRPGTAPSTPSGAADASHPARPTAAPHRRRPA